MLSALARLCHQPQLRGMLCIVLPLLMAFASFVDDRRPRLASPPGVTLAVTPGPPPLSADPSPHARNVRAAYFGELEGSQLKPRTDRDPSVNRPTGPFVESAECERGPPRRWAPILAAVMAAERPHHGCVALAWRTRGCGQRAPPPAA